MFVLLVFMRVDRLAENIFAHRVLFRVNFKTLHKFPASQKLTQLSSCTFLVPDKLAPVSGTSFWYTSFLSVCHPLWHAGQLRTSAMSAATDDQTDGGRRLPVRLCRLHIWTDFTGYGFNLFAIKGRRGHYVQNVERESPAETGGLRVGDRIVEVNGINISNENHQQVKLTQLSNRIRRRRRRGRREEEEKERGRRILIDLI